MGNPHRGLRRVTLPRDDPKEHEPEPDIYRMRFSMNSLCEFEERTGIPITEFEDDTIDSMGMRGYRTLIFCALMSNHPRLTEEKVGDLVPLDRMKEVGQAAGQCLLEAFQSGGDEEGDDEGEASGAGPS